MRTDRQQTQSVYGTLMAGFAASAQEDPEVRWHWLAAAHVVGQMDFRLHLHSHRQMLAFAMQQGDWREAAGQVFRLALVPLGHVLGRLPAGNTGRASVNAFRPMPVASPVRELIAQARKAVAAKDLGGSGVSPLVETSS
jgi:Protein of unknown function (DUF3703)